MKSVLLLITFLLGTATIQCALDSSLFEGCGVTKTCIGTIPVTCACPQPNCDVLFTLQDMPANESLRIELFSDENYDYMAMGFSNDEMMPDSDVVGCQKRDATTVDAKNTYNPSYTNTPDGDNSAVELISYNITGNFFSCVFTRTYQPQVSSRGFTLNTSNYFIFSAIGNNGFRAESDAFLQHASTPCITDERINTTSILNVASSSVDYLLTRVHGSLMLLGWLVFISTGVFFANYTKLLLPNGEWFHLHKYINMSGIIIAVIGIIVIFVALGEWKMGSNALLAHQIFGLFSTFLMLLNPIIAAFRCRPAATYRWIFRLIHGAIGYIAITCAGVAIGLGLALYYELIGRTIDQAIGFWIYIAKVIADWFFYIPLIIFLCYKGWTPEKVEKTNDMDMDMDMDKDYSAKTGAKDKLPSVNPLKLFLHNIFALPQCPTGADRKKPVREWPFITGFLIAFIIFTICFYLAIVVVVGIAEDI